VDTPLYERFIPQDQIERTIHGFDAFHPIGRIGTARDIASTVTFLLAPRDGLGDGRDLECGCGVMAGRN
jgi:NAD(P)-dependent dehydrogenase (short-subunit alcohol dehydrogenase family)